jgi:hypothetical protein
MTASTPDLPLHLALQRENWRRKIEGARPGDLENLKKIARLMLDGFYDRQQALEESYRRQLSAPFSAAGTAGPQLPRLPKQSH